MAARIEQLEHKLAAMVGLEASTSTSYEGEDFSYLASVAQVEASVAVTRGGARTSEPRGAIVELDPQRDEDGYVPSSAVMRMATSVLRSSFFSATELMDSGIDLQKVWPPERSS
ncbi:hypothetical protein AXG93_3756s1350 [Marchantia polymorpha subsp. ruderalis]|uniref:Uncharacterized protein n=1 Tax=Marchantia polymorpha subsp. ruderalis TaxID=1480154 RepID=A0A176VFE7_MARPO|nr:hypothetical protein AXG93_3756s1350 [Marchantia polymorpha subsp. ruderalis]